MLGCLAWNGVCRTAARLKGLTWLLWLVAPPAVWAQTPSAAPDWVVDTWQAEGGLPHNAVTAILQTWDGYLWVGTSNGLARFDGVRFTTFRSVDTPGLRSNRILCLYEDAYGVLWIGTDGGGLACYHAGQFTALGSEEGLSSDTVLCLGEDTAGGLWVGTDSGLNRRLTGRFTTFFKTDGLPDDRVSAISQPAGSSPLFSTGNGLCQYRREALRPLGLPVPPEDQADLSCLREDIEGRLWLGGEHGLYRFGAADANDARHPEKVPLGEVFALVERKTREMWFGTRAGELGRVVSDGNSLKAQTLWRSAHAVTALCEDMEGNLWVGTAGEGLHRFKARLLRLVPLPETQNASGSLCLFLTPQGGLRLVTGDKNLYDWQDNQFVLMKRLPLPDGVSLQTACQTRSGELWVGTVRDGLFECGSSVVQQFSERDGLSDSAIEVLCGDGDGGLWIGTRNGGLNHFKDRKVTRFNTPWGFQGTYACALEPDAHGSLWIGTSGDGLFRLRDGKFTGYTVASGLPSDQILTLHADESDSLWVGTDKGLCRVRDGRVATFGGGNGLPEEAILQLDSDREGNLWVGSGSRIFRVQKEKLNAFAEGRAPFVGVVAYGKEDGLPGVQCVPRVQWRRRGAGADRIRFATTRGLVVVERQDRPWNSTPPPVVVETVFVDNVSVPFGDGVRVAPGKGSLRFEYTALSLTAPGKVGFRYRLDGIDTEWSEPGPSREARYPKVPPGNYRFQVVACNNDGVWNETGATVAVAVVPFWWETPWFRVAVGLAVAGIVGGLYRMRQTRRRELERLRVRIASDLHDDIGSSLWSITLLSRMLTKHGNLGAEERQDLEEIHRIAIQTSNAIRDIIWLINPAFDTLQDLILRMKDFAGTALRGVDYRVNSEDADLTRKLPFEFRHNLFLLFKEALTNIARHAQATVVEVRIEEQGNAWRLTIRDNGRGFDPNVNTGGNGLRNLRTRAARMKASLEVHSQPGHGTRLILSTPRLD